MHIPKHLPQIQYDYDLGLTTISYGFIGRTLGCLFVLLLPYFFNSNLRSINNKNYKFSYKFKIKLLLLSSSFK